MKLLFGVLLGVVSLSGGCGGGENRASEDQLKGSGPLGPRCTVARIVDGDTVDCAESEENARLLLIDAPELAQGDIGRQAREALARLIPVGTVTTIELDLDPRDQYGRDLVYLYLGDGRMVNEEMTRLGYAVVSIYPPNVRHVDRIRGAQEEARHAKIGLWSGSAFDCEPRDYRAGRCE